MTYRPANPNGQATMDNSAPVVIASNQSAVDVANVEVEVASLFQALYNDVDILVKNTPGYFSSVVVTNINDAVRFFQIINKASAPTGGDTALLSIPIPAGSSTSPGYLILDQGFFGAGGLSCSTGIAVGISTTAGTFTAATITDHTISGMYI